ncbi:hypothetical protein [Priestia megaterium]
MKKVAEQLGMRIDMVRHPLRNQELNEKFIIGKRNERLVELFSFKSSHRTLADKFNRIVEQLKNEYPHLTFGAVKNYYYSLKKEV